MEQKKWFRKTIIAYVLSLIYLLVSPFKNTFDISALAFIFGIMGCFNKWDQAYRAENKGIDEQVLSKAENYFATSAMLLFFAMQQIGKAQIASPFTHMLIAGAIVCFVLGKTQQKKL